jgi:hypothetical protein
MEELIIIWVFQVLRGHHTGSSNRLVIYLASPFITSNDGKLPNFAYCLIAAIPIGLEEKLYAKKYLVVHDFFFANHYCTKCRH